MKQSPQKGQAVNKKSPVQSPQQQKGGKVHRTANQKETNQQQMNRHGGKNQQFNKKYSKNEQSGNEPEKKRTEFLKPSQERQITAKEKTGRLVIRNLSFKVYVNFFVFVLNC